MSPTRIPPAITITDLEDIRARLLRKSDEYHAEAEQHTAVEVRQRLRMGAQMYSELADILEGVVSK